MNAPFTPAGCAALVDWGVIRARGADAASFLHGQLTNSVTSLDGRSARLAGYCSAKGRLLASVIVWKTADGDLLLACHASVLAATLKRLAMFVLRAKCVLSDASGEVPLAGLVGIAGLPAGNAAADGLPVWGQREIDGATWIRLPDADGLPRALLAGTPPALPALDIAAWRRLDVASGVPTIEAANVDQFVPQMLNLELIGGVDFQKGCYPGQEVVARSQYRGTIKRRLFRFESSGAANPGDDVFHSEDAAQPAGRVCNAAALGGGGSALLAEVKLAALGRGSLHLGNPGGPLLAPLPLPYEVPLPLAELTPAPPPEPLPVVPSA